MSEIQRLIADGEGRQLDFEISADDKQNIARILVALANTEGGRLLIGVNDKGRIKGVNPEEELSVVEEISHGYCQPELNIESNIWEEGHHLLLEVSVKKSEIRHKAIDEGGRWKHYIRVENLTLLSNKILERTWHLEKCGQDRPHVFDELTTGFLKLIREESPFRISKLYKKSGMKMNEVDKLLAQLVYWKVVQMEMSEFGTFYSIKE